jgi:pyruvate formate lyase activating enzyme
VKCADAELHKKWTGVDNRLILENLSRLSKKGAKLWIRIPVISGVNDSELEMKKIGKILRTIKVERIELLPYHAMGEAKYRAVYHKEPQQFSAVEKQTLDRLYACVIENAN